MKKKALWIFILIFFLLGCYHLFVPIESVVGDDGVQTAVREQLGLYQTENALQFGIAETAQGGGNPLVSALVQGFRMAGIGIFDVRVLSAIELLLCSLGLWLALSKMNFRTPWLNYAVSGLSVLIFADQAYTAYFNTLTYEGIFLAFFSVAVGSAIYLFLSDSPKLWTVVLYILASLGMAASAKNMIVLLPFTVILAVWIAFLRKEAWYRTVSILLAVLLAAGGSALAWKAEMPNRDINRYQSVFYGIYYGREADAETAKAELAEMGIDPEYASLVGTSYYESGLNAEETEALGTQIRYSAIAKYYFTHPMVMWRNLGNAAKNGFFLKQGFLTYGAGGADGKPSLSIWSFLKEKLPLQNIWMLAVLWVALLVISIINRTKEPGGKPLTVGIWLLVLLPFVLFMPVYVSGMALISKTLFPFGAIMDTVLILVFGMGIQKILDLRDEKKEKFGVTQ